MSIWNRRLGSLSHIYFALTSQVLQTADFNAKCVRPHRYFRHDLPTIVLPLEDSHDKGAVKEI